ncbi:copper resistance CopC family protein [Labedella endophytica]|uniref:Copper resistance protein CopC n=1 Tax=Labedella endophytica TaxID=1523160 RepID=A0A3S0XC23_9MICO|nr:copper resistance CopC family protein [Labedella endophytica]RUR01892.1 copper resistance protein CopC [Labedella endophytica]
MSTTTPSGARRRPRVLLAAATALGIVLAATTAIAPAQAHDQLVSSTPTADASLDPAPTEVALTYSDNILEVGVEVVVTDADGEDWVAEAPVVDGPTVTVPLESDMPGGAYTVDWRVVSSDGHPISGSIPFTVTTPVAMPTPTASEPAATTPTDSVTSAPSVSADPESTDSDAANAEDGLSGAHLAIIAGIVLVVLLIVAGIIFLLIRRRNDGAGPGQGGSL